MNQFGLENVARSGTSYATPSVSGQVVQLLSRQPGQTLWPETNKAAVLVSALNDVDPSLGEHKDGVGAVVMSYSDDTYKSGRFANHYLGPFSPFTRVLRTYSIPLTAGRQARVAIAWDSWSTAGAGTNQLGVDLDLVVTAPDGSMAGQGTRGGEAWDMADFFAPVAGTYTVYRPIT